MLQKAVDQRDVALSLQAVDLISPESVWSERQAAIS
jgi:hypothetical protein